MIPDRCLEELLVLYDGRPIGRLAVTERTARKIIGRFLPGPGSERCRAAFEEAAQWFSQWEKTSLSPEMDYAAWDRWIEIIRAITARIGLPEVPQGIEEFAVDNTSEVEVTLFLSAGSTATPEEKGA